MKIKIQLMVLFIFACLFLIMQPFAVFAELIEPTRTLRGHKKTEKKKGSPIKGLVKRKNTSP